MPTTKPRLHIRVDFSAPWFCIMAILSFGIGYQLLMAQAGIGELAGQFTDNHTYIVRMLETEWWRDHGWLTQINAPDGIILHWTFPFPALLTAFALPFWPFMDWPHAMVYGGSIIATALYLLIGLLVYRLSRYITTPGWACIAAIIVLSARPMLSYGAIGRPDHHLLAVLLVMGYWWALIAMETGHRYRAGIMAAICAALALWTTPETMAGLVLGLGLQCWYRIVPGANDAPDSGANNTPDPTVRNRLTGDVLFALIWIGLLCLMVRVDPPYEGIWVAAYDRLSIVHIVFAACTGILIVGRSMVMLAMNRLGHQDLIPQTVALGALGTTTVICFLVLFPAAPAGAINHVAPELKSWINNIQEMQPSASLLHIYMNIGVPLLGLFGLVLLWEDRAEFTERQKLLILGSLITLILLTVVGALYFRFSYFAVVASGPFVAILLSRLAKTKISWLQPDLLVPLIIGTPLLVANSLDIMSRSGVIDYRLFAVPNVSGTALPYTVRAPETDANGLIVPLEHPIGQAACNNFPMVDYLHQLEPALARKWGRDTPMIIMANQNPGPAILYKTDFNIISAPYHRNTQGILDERRFFGTPGTDALNEVIDRRNIAVAAICIKPVIDQPDLERPGVYDWAIRGGDERFGVALIIPGEWVILARQELLDDWAPVIKLADPDAPDISDSNASN